MTVDLSKLKAGDTVHFRCGGSMEASEICHNGPLELVVINEVHAWDIGGRHWREVESPFDIIHIDPKPCLKAAIDAVDVLITDMITGEEGRRVHADVCVELLYDVKRYLSHAEELEI